MADPDYILSLSTSDLSTSCCLEMTRYRRHQNSNPAYCLELFRRALQINLNDAWERLLSDCVAEFLRGKLVRHASWEAARRYQDARSYVVEAFARFWRSNAGHPLRQESLGGLLSLLHRCLHSAILEELRLWEPPDSRGGPPVELSESQAGPDPMDIVLSRERLREIWECALSDRERRIFRLRWLLGYTPKAMVDNWPQDYPNTRDISQTLQNILARYYRRKRPLGEA